MSSSDVSEQILSVVQDICTKQEAENSTFKKYNLANRFLDVFKENLVTAINETYFGKGLVEMEDSEAIAEKEKQEYEDAVVTVGARRKKATKLCKDIKERTLAVEKKIIKCIQVADVSSLREDEDKTHIEDSENWCRLNRDRIKTHAKCIAENLNYSTMQIMHRTERAEALIEAATYVEESVCVEP